MIASNITLNSLSMTDSENNIQDKAAPSESSLVSQGDDRTFPNEIVEDVLTTVWLQRCPVDRWLFYRAMLGVNRQWGAIMRHVCLRFVIVESPRDLENYHRIVLKVKDKIPDDAEFVEFFRRTHVRVDVDALVQQPMLPACRLLELTHAEEREYVVLSAQTCPHLDSWLRIPHLKVVSVLQHFTRLDKVVSKLPPTVTHLQGRFVDLRFADIAILPKWATLWLSQITHLRACPPRPLIPFVEHTLNLEELTLDLRDPSVLSYTIVAALKAGIFRKSKKKLILNTGPTEPICYGPVAATCKRLGIVLERRVVYGNEGSSSLAVHDGIPTFFVPEAGLHGSRVPQLRD